MKIFNKQLADQGLGEHNSVVIGSGILNEKGIRESDDIDAVVTAEEFTRLHSTGKFKEEKSHDKTVLAKDDLEIAPYWGVLGKDYHYDDLLEDSEIIDGVRYIGLDFLLRVKRSWCTDEDVRQKDIDDVELIENYMRKG